MPRKKKLRARLKRPGAAPGTLVHTGEERSHSVRLHRIAYGPSAVEEEVFDRFDLSMLSESEQPVIWLDFDGIHDIELIQELGQVFGLHPLLLEDLVNTSQRPKLEDYGEHLYLVVRMLSYSESDHRVESEQVSIILTPRHLLSLQERPGDVFEAVRARLRSGKGYLRKRGSDYLAYALIDAVVDHYFVVLEKIGDRIEILEEEVSAEGAVETLHDIYSLKREMLVLRKSIWPLREVVGSLLREDTPLITKDIQVFLRDVYDHTIQVVDTAESLRETLSGLLDLYLSIVSNRMNEVMKVLTIIATIFIPLTFIAGIYGMNFEFMPELGLRWAYPAVWVVMLLVGLVMVLYFKRKHWL